MAGFNIQNIDDKFYEKVKIYAIKNKITVKDLIVKLLKEELKKERDVV